MLPDPTAPGGMQPTSLEERQHAHHHHHHRRHHKRKTWSASLSEQIADAIERHRPLLLALLAACVLLVVLLWLFQFAQHEAITHVSGT
ncbi:MAG: hypothetical protein JST27_00200 [Bacteroidetes bacterium]|nr:hypothetical protein [Bacteroidota bacterium]